MREIPLETRGLTKDGESYVGLLMSAVRDVGKDLIPRTIDGGNLGKIALVDLEWLRGLIDAREELDWLVAQPDHQRYVREVVRAQSSRRELESQLQEADSRALGIMCPACRRLFVERFGDDGKRKEARWKAVRDFKLRDALSERDGRMFDRVARRSGQVGVAGTTETVRAGED